MSAININNPTPISFDGDDFKAIAGDLQGNILKSHGRHHSDHIFFRFNNPDLALSFTARLAQADFFTSAGQQKTDTEEQKQNGTEKLFANLYLTSNAYQFLGKQDKMPGDDKFRHGLRISRADLNDPPVEDWDDGFQAKDLHGVILLAHADRATLDAETAKLVLQLHQPNVITVLTIERGDAIFNNDGEPIEHFGYVDGISQPLFFQEDIDKLPSITAWNPFAPLSQVLVADQGGASENSFGSYFVFRKLEENVRGFNEAEERLGNDLVLPHSDMERAGAMVIGRFENGMPATLSATDDDATIIGNPTFGDKVGQINNFTYNADGDGAKCPFHGHVRKSNPRGGSGQANEKTHRMARRGVTYGRRNVEPKDEPTFEEMPTKDVGLLFMSFQSSIENQFEFIQKRWVNDPTFPNFISALDPVIGQDGQGNISHGHYAKTWGNKPSLREASFGNFVTLKGGEYFFAPSISFLKGLAVQV